MIVRIDCQNRQCAHRLYRLSNFQLTLKDHFRNDLYSYYIRQSSEHRKQLQYVLQLKTITKVSLGAFKLQGASSIQNIMNVFRSYRMIGF